jgi:hypothetical protein
LRQLNLASSAAPSLKAAPTITPTVVQDLEEGARVRLVDVRGRGNQQQNASARRLFWGWLDRRWTQRQSRTKTFPSNTRLAGRPRHRRRDPGRHGGLGRGGNDNDNLIIQCDLNTTMAASLAGGGQTARRGLKSTPILPKFKRRA